MKSRVWRSLNNSKITLAFIAAVYKISGMNSEACGPVSRAHVQLNASEFIGRRFTSQMYKDPKNSLSYLRQRS